MANAIRFEDRLGGSEEFSAWKFRIKMILRENKVDSYVQTESAQPEDETEKSTWIEGNDKAIKIIVDGVRNNIMPIIRKQETAYKMFKALEKTFEISNASRTLALKREINHITMNKGETINAYFMRISVLKDELATLDYEIRGKELTLIALDGLPSGWSTFVQGISARSKYPKFERLRDDCLQEESRLNKVGIKQKNIDEDLQVLNTNINKKYKKKQFRKRKAKQGKNTSKKDLSHVQCYRCDKCGHYVANCPEKGKQATFAKVKKSRKENDSENYVLYSALTSHTSNKSNSWVIDSGSSRHITGFREILDSMIEKDDEEVTIGDDSSHPVRGIGTCTIKLKSGMSLNLKKQQQNQDLLTPLNTGR
ncbi:retrovirus-related Pol polyprotein from transposon RE1 isoform X1 [Cryptomeria japonica]|uniref:retrovirus-related Pol polyprotein from transposon RE1 isoform X1 n=1 Tax=Cryptomeria japonica TaxID=3369 RepID=UPI0027DA9C5C|nr:retrovirus-related Pol polyprotein from transposon RE1 isoform X1 [Cryptomeria japonica]XP_059069263.1 retrovirus-related Pol polyprotein from transposon RE1 isoform X1 [Cryptomeria japonica]XP_059069264.1 retrovirus-related Pol polyprotein from transposon RE1 isoform X1 [Cryptomeria japonica]